MRQHFRMGGRNHDAFTFNISDMQSLFQSKYPKMNTKIEYNKSVVMTVELARATDRRLRPPSAPLLFCPHIPESPIQSENRLSQTARVCTIWTAVYCWVPFEWRTWNLFWCGNPARFQSANWIFWVPLSPATTHSWKWWTMCLWTNFECMRVTLASIYTSQICTFEQW